MITLEIVSRNYDEEDVLEISWKMYLKMSL
jgi:hypothetical protein